MTAICCVSCGLALSPGIANTWRRIAVCQSNYQMLRKRKPTRCGRSGSAIDHDPTLVQFSERNRTLWSHHKLSTIFSNALGCAVGDLLGSSTTGEALSALHSLQLGLCNSLLDERQKPSKTAPRCTPDPARSPMSVPAAAIMPPLDTFWICASACLLFAALKLVHGQPDIALSSCQDKLLSMVVSNHVLWPLARFLNASIVPKQHQAVTNILIHTTWSACLSSLGHVPNLISLTGNALNLHHLSTATSFLKGLTPEVATTAAQAVHMSVESAMSPLLSQAADAVDSATDMLESIPSALMQEVLSSTLDLVTPVRRMVRRPSQLQGAGMQSLSAHKLGAY